MHTPQVFWMVKGAGPANAIHPTRKSAEQEAQRLASANPGTTFYVMQAMAAHRKVDVDRYDLSEAAEYAAEEEMIPF